MNDYMFQEASYRAMNTIFRSIASDNTDHISVTQGDDSSMSQANHSAELPNKVDATDHKAMEVEAPRPIHSTSSHDEPLSEDNITVPEEPLYISPVTHFETYNSVNVIKNCIDNVLFNRDGVSFEFFPHRCRWEAVYLVGSTRSKFEICVYRHSLVVYVIEGNRLSGDGFVFTEIYQAIRCLIMQSFEEVSPYLLPNPGFDETTVDDMESAIDSVLAMAESGIAEAQLGAAQIFCDIFSREAVPQGDKLRKCITSLVKLTQVDFQFCNQHAICALAQLSSSRSSQEVLSHDKEFLTNIMKLCADGNYNTIGMRRECARLLANLSCSSGSNAGAWQVIDCAGVDCVESWLKKVDALKDETLRLHANRAKDALAKCFLLH